MKTADIDDRQVVLPDVSGEPVALRQERERRRMSREELADQAGISVTWLRQIEAGMFWPGEEARGRIRAALAECPVHRAFGVECKHKLPVPPDEVLYSKLSDLKSPA